MLHLLVVMAGEVVDDLVGAQGVAGQDDVPVTLPLGKCQIGVDILIGIGKTLVPGTDQLFLAGIHVDCLDLPEGVIGLGVDEVDPAVIQRIADVVIKRIGVKIAVNAGNGDHYGVCRPLLPGAEQHAAEHHASLRRHIQSVHIVIGHF